MNLHIILEHNTACRRLPVGHVSSAIPLRLPGTLLLLLESGQLEATELGHMADV